MRQYFTRWALGTLVVAPLMLFLVPLVHRLLYSLPGPHAPDSVWMDFMSMLGFYGGYVAAAATVGSLSHTWLVRRFRRLSPAGQVISASAIGVIVLAPQGIAFGPGYLGVNLVAGAAAGALFGVLTRTRPGN